MILHSHELHELPQNAASSYVGYTLPCWYVTFAQETSATITFSSSTWISGCDLLLLQAYTEEHACRQLKKYLTTQTQAIFCQKLLFVPFE